MSQFSWDITVRRMDHYNERVVSKTPMTVIAANKSEVTEKVRAAFEATYDGFRKFWSHGWVLNSVTEIAAPTDSDARTAPAADTAPRGGQLNENNSGART